MITDEPQNGLPEPERSFKIPPNETPEQRHERMAALAKRGGAAIKGKVKNQKRLRDLTTKILNSPIPLNGKLAEILFKVGIKTDSRTSAAEGIMGVFTAKALSGDLKAAQFVFDSAGWSGNARLLSARLEQFDRMMANPEGTELPANTPQQHVLDLREIDQEAQRMGLYETIEQTRPEDAQKAEGGVVDD